MKCPACGVEMILYRRFDPPAQTGVPAERRAGAAEVAAALPLEEGRGKGYEAQFVCRNERCGKFDSRLKRKTAAEES